MSPRQSNGNGGTDVGLVKFEIPKLMPRVAELLPKYMDPARFIRVARLIVTQNPDLLDPKKTDPLSVLASILDAASIGLEIGREAHLVRYGRQCTMLPDYRGYQKLALQTGAVRVIEARVVYESDAFEWAEGTTPHITHRPNWDARRGDKDVKAFYCVAHFPDGSNTFLVRTPEQIEHIRSKSRAKDNGPWVTDWQAMGMKTVIKEICDKRLLMLPNSERLSAAIELDNRAETGEITRPVGADSEESIREHVAEQTRQRQTAVRDELKEKIAEKRDGDDEESTMRKEDADLLARDA